MTFGKHQKNKRRVNIVVKPGSFVKFSWQYEGNQKKFFMDSSPAEKNEIEVLFEFPPNSINTQAVTIQSEAVKCH